MRNGTEEGKSGFFYLYTHRVNSNVFIFMRIIVPNLSKLRCFVAFNHSLFKYSVFGSIVLGMSIKYKVNKINIT